MTLGLGVITRNKEVDILDRCLASVHKYVDNIYITHAEAGCEPSLELKELAKKYKAKLSHFEWINDFSAARNFNMSQCSDDWYVWADSDDTVRGMEKAKPLLATLPESVGHVLCTYEYSYFPGGKVDNAHPKERFLRMRDKYTWKGYLHETAVKDEAIGVRFDKIVWEHHVTSERSKESAERNIAIIEREIGEQAKGGHVDPRTVFNLGMALASVAQATDGEDDWQRCIRAFYRYLDMSGWDLHAFMAWRFIGVSFMRLQRPELALNAYFECLKIEPNYKDAYASLGQAYLALQDKDKARAWLNMALLAGKENAYASDRSTSMVQPLLSLAELEAHDGKLNNAEKYIRFAKKYTGVSDGPIMEMEKIIKEAKKEEKEASKAVEGLKTREDYEKLDPKFKAHPKIVDWRRNHIFKTSTSGKEVLIYCGQSWEEWTPESEKTGIGGSEEAVINMARELKALGYDVSVFGSHGTEPKDYDGVTYWPFWAYNPNEPTDIFIGWRNPSIFDLKVKAKKRYLWLHDVVAKGSLTESRLANLDKVMVLSQYHRDLYPHVPDSKIFLTGNGINPKHFDLDIKRNPFKVMYSSAPNRGLKVLLEMWPKIKERVPKAELYWAYGWKTYDLGMKTSPQGRRYKEEVVELLKQPGVVELGRIGHEELAKHMAETSVWAYPTEFPEIFCITAVKMQAAGAIPIHSGVAAVGEKTICPFGINLDCKDIYTNKEAQQKFIDAVVEKLNSPAPREPMMDWAKGSWSWANTAKGWDMEFNS